MLYKCLFLYLIGEEVSHRVRPLFRSELHLFLVLWSWAIYLIYYTSVSLPVKWANTSTPGVIGRHMCSHYGEQYGASLKKLKIELPSDPAIPLLGVSSEKMKTLIWKDTCTPMFRAALYTTAKTWKQPKCPSTDDWLKKMWYMCVCVLCV